MFTHLSALMKASLYYLIAFGLAVLPAAVLVSMPELAERLGSIDLYMLTPVAAVLLMLLVATRDGWSKSGWQLLGAVSSPALLEYWAGESGVLSLIGSHSWRSGSSTACDDSRAWCRWVKRLPISRSHKEPHARRGTLAARPRGVLKHYAKRVLHQTERPPRRTLVGLV